MISLGDMLILVKGERIGAHDIRSCRLLMLTRMTGRHHTIQESHVLIGGGGSSIRGGSHAESL